jgi:acetylornithine/N-succinyldiaminopimelate aminotransferase
MKSTPLSTYHTDTAMVTSSDRFFTPNYGNRPITLRGGKGCYVNDDTGKEYLDFAAGIAVSILGHGNQRVASAIALQAQTLLHASNYYHTQPSIQLAKQLTDLSGYDSVFFCNSGTEANEGAIKFARAAHFRSTTPHGVNKRPRTICFERCFHGRTLGALSATHSSRYREPFAPLLPGFEFLPFNDVDALKAAMNSDVTAVILEPVQGEGGVWPCSIEFIHAVAELCKQTGAIFICDEIQCSLGRLGSHFAFQKFEVSPDIITLAKPLAAGLPMGAVLVNARIRNAIEAGDHGSTFGGNPVCAAAALVVLDELIRADLAGLVRRNEPIFQSILKDLAADYPSIIGSTRGLGYLRALDTVIPAKQLVDAARHEGLLILSAGNNTLRFAPPLIANESDFNQFNRRLRSAVDQIRLQLP